MASVTSSPNFITTSNHWPLKNIKQFHRLIYPESSRPNTSEAQQINAYKAHLLDLDYVISRDEAVRENGKGVVIQLLESQTPKRSTDTSSTSPPEHARPRFPVLDLSQNISEPDSLIDLYKYRRTIQQTPISPDFPRTPFTPDSIMAAVRSPVVGEDQEAKWIHRDKLTQIEIQEYIDRGMQPPAELLSRAAQRGESMRSRQAKYPDNSSTDVYHKKQRINSPDHFLESPIDDNEEPFVPEDPRSPEEIAEDYYEDSNGNTMHRLRSSSSKIPIATSSPLPIPVEHLERDTPLRRKRGTSDDWDEEGTPQIRMRSRGNSISSQILLDDERFGSPSSPPQSPSKNKNSSKTKAPTNANRIVNSKMRTDGSRIVSGQRPGTRTGTNDRPRTAVNRPEGDPPWLDQIYRPDPMLPPDQQLLPTHAKRMRAEQWEREGKTGSVYDREFAPVQLYDETKMKPYSESEDPYQEPQIQSEGQGQSQGKKSSFEPSNDSQWPLKPTNALEVPKSPIADHGGYSTMPKVQKSPIVGPPPSPRPPEQQLQVQDEKIKKEKGGCGCCIVM